MNILSRCWNKDHWIKYNLTIGEYQNLLDFLIYHSLFHLSETTLDFDNIPYYLRGKRNSKNLLEYIQYNDNPRLIFDFCNYFFNYIINAKYDSGANVLHEFVYNDLWTNQTLKIKNPFIVSTTTLAPTTTTTLAPTTTTTTLEPTTTTTLAPTTTTTLAPTTTTTTTLAPTTTTTTLAPTTTTTTLAPTTTTTLAIETLFIHIQNKI